MAKLKTRNCKCCDGSGRELDQTMVGEYLRFQREKAGIPQARVAEFMHISKPYLCDLEHGFRNWRDELISKYKKAIGI